MKQILAHHQIQDIYQLHSPKYTVGIFDGTSSEPFWG